ncbi:FAD-binding monooxygenase [Penicillium cataractarum]|uniref:FAD-binding monooxygenase n=1 Tax=Penicillium cataractarum TaxID=2100454 RepID=A0A9W9V5M0_9EURO|nr:FAD-binding monooxygenase [Penicillium cataractarum]KAJ5368559.1 FAD-binding monooxygenase [Penicillium cataractarum]
MTVEIESFETPVLIIGGGPVGLTTALLLARYGIPSTVVERYPGRLGQPKAHAVNPRSLEILRQAGLDTVQLRRVASRPVDADLVRFGLSPLGLELGTLPFERQGEENKAITPEPLFNIPQPELEEWLMDVISKESLVTLKRGFQWESCTGPQDAAAQVMSKVIERETMRRLQITSKYLLACDGARSGAREKLEIPFSVIPDGPTKESHHVTIHFEADLSHLKSGIIWYVFGAKQQGAFLAYDRSNSWVYVTNWDGNPDSKAKFTDEYCAKLINEAMGQEFPFKVLSTTLWTTHPRIADFYRSKKQPQAFLLGDAAHAFPPTGGLGVNTGIADAQNLAWKINAVEKGWSNLDFLDTYNNERRPVAMANARQSAKNQRTVYKFFSARPEIVTDEELERNTEWRNQFAIDIANDAEHFDSINLQLGYVYGGKAWDDVPCNEFTPRCVPGIRLPHAWVSQKALTRSSLDLVDGLGFTVLGSADCLPSCSSGFVDSKTGVEVKIQRLAEDFSCDNKAWLDMTGLASQGKGLLIRPDQHVLGEVQSPQDVQDLLSSFLLRD